MKPAALDPIVHQPVRLQILGALFRNRQVSFTSLRDGLGLTAGNLASHAQKLVDAGYVEGGRVLAGLSFEVRYRITAKGTNAFRQYLADLRHLLAGIDAGPTPETDGEASETTRRPSGS